MAIKGQTDQETSGKGRSEAKVLVIGQQENLQALSLVQASLFPVLAEGEGRHVSMFCQMLSTSASKQPELQSFHLQLCRMPERTAKNAGYALIGGRGLAPVAEDLGILADAGNSGAAVVQPDCLRSHWLAVLLAAKCVAFSCLHFLLAVRSHSPCPPTSAEMVAAKARSVAWLVDTQCVARHVKALMSDKDYVIHIYPEQEHYSKYGWQAGMEFCMVQEFGVAICSRAVFVHASLISTHKTAVSC